MELQPNTYYHTRDKRIAYVLGAMPLTSQTEHRWIVAYDRHGEFSLFGHSYRYDGRCNLNGDDAPEDLIEVVPEAWVLAQYGIATPD